MVTQSARRRLGHSGAGRGWAAVARRRRNYARRLGSSRRHRSDHRQRSRCRRWWAFAARRAVATAGRTRPRDASTDLLYEVRGMGETGWQAADARVWRCGCGGAGVEVYMRCTRGVQEVGIEGVAGRWGWRAVGWLRRKERGTKQADDHPTTPPPHQPTNPRPHPPAQRACSCAVLAARGTIQRAA